MLHPVRIIEIERGSSCDKHMFRGEDVKHSLLIKRYKTWQVFSVREKFKTTNQNTNSLTHHLTSFEKIEV